jgi:[ribosomal protein S18]-alanine N-acetyltransferase
VAAKIASPTTEIQRLCAADLDAVLEIERLSFRTPWQRPAFEAELAHTWSRLEVVRETATGRILAFADYWLVSDEVHVLNIATHPQARRQGHGARLLRHIVDQAKTASFKCIDLEVRRSNEAAQALYASHGFQVVGMRPRYYEDNDEDAILMTLKL